MKTIDNREFVAIWMNAYNNVKGLKWIAGRFGMNKRAVSDKAWHLRKRGVKLPYMQPLEREATVSELNNIVDKMKEK